MSAKRCNADLGPLTAKLLEQEREIGRLTAERDEARRMVCELESGCEATPREYAKEMWWDCYRYLEDNK